MGGSGGITRDLIIRQGLLRKAVGFMGWISSPNTHDVINSKLFKLDYTLNSVQEASAKTM